MPSGCPQATWQLLLTVQNDVLSSLWPELPLHNPLRLPCQRVELVCHLISWQVKESGISTRDTHSSLHTPPTPMHLLYKQVHLHAQTYTYPWLCKYTYISMALYVCTHTHIYAYTCSQISIPALHIHFYPQQIHAQPCSSVRVYQLHTRIVGLPQSQISPTQTLTCSRLCIPLHTPGHSLLLCFLKLSTHPGVRSGSQHSTVLTDGELW